MGPIFSSSSRASWGPKQNTSGPLNSFSWIAHIMVPRKTAGRLMPAAHISQDGRMSEGNCSSSAKFSMLSLVIRNIPAPICAANTARPKFAAVFLSMRARSLTQLMTPMIKKARGKDWGMIRPKA